MLPAFLPQIQFDQLAQYSQILPCLQALAVLPPWGHRGLSVREKVRGKILVTNQWTHKNFS